MCGQLQLETEKVLTVLVLNWSMCQFHQAHFVNLIVAVLTLMMSESRKPPVCPPQVVFC